MADIAAFRGIVYDTTRADLSSVIAPPYDVIDENERAALLKRSPRNIVKLDLPRDRQGRAEGDARYADAGAELESWLSDGTLLRDDRPALYRYHQVFTVGDREHTRRGFIALLRLTPFSEGVVLPHERTLSGPKVDRLKLMRATRAAFSQVFGLYRDEGAAIDSSFAAVEGGPPAFEGRTPDGVRHRVWRLTDAAAVSAVTAAMETKKIYIADGHHRYETMIALRDELRAANPTAPVRSALGYGSIYLMSASDPGLVVLPTHRLLRGLASFDPDALVARAAEHFTVTATPLADAQALASILADRGSTGPTFALATHGRTNAYLLTLKPEARSALVAHGVHEALCDLDVAVLHALVLERLLRIDRAAQEQQTHLGYVKDLGKALEALGRGEAQAALLMNPTRVEQVLRAADAGCVMPQKSTFFYPKIASGLVMNRILPGEIVGQTA